MEDILSDNPSIQLEKASSQRRNLSGIIDAFMVVALFIALAYLLPEAVWTSLQLFGRPELNILIGLAVYRLLTLFLMNETFGMRISRIQLLNGDFKKLSPLEKFTAAFFVLIHDTIYYKKK